MVVKEEPEEVRYEFGDLAIGDRIKAQWGAKKMLFDAKVEDFEEAGPFQSKKRNIKVAPLNSTPTTGRHNPRGGLATDLHKAAFDKVALPQQQRARFRATYYFAIRHLIHGTNIRKLDLTKLTNTSLQLQTSESRGHLPETNMARSACSKAAIVILAESNIKHVLAKRF